MHINYQFLLLRGALGWSLSLFFMARRTEMGIGSMAALIISGPIILLGLNEVGLMILLTDVGLFESLILLVLFCLYLSPPPLETLLCTLSLIWSWDTSALSYLLLSHLPAWSSKSLSMIFLWHTVQGLVLAPQDCTCLSYSIKGQVFSQYLQCIGFRSHLSWCDNISWGSIICWHMEHSTFSWNYFFIIKKLHRVAQYLWRQWASHTVYTF